MSKTSSESSRGTISISFVDSGTLKSSFEHELMKSFEEFDKILQILVWLKSSYNLYADDVVSAAKTLEEQQQRAQNCKNRLSQFGDRLNRHKREIHCGISGGTPASSGTWYHFLPETVALTERRVHVLMELELGWKKSLAWQGNWRFLYSSSQRWFRPILALYTTESWWVKSTPWKLACRNVRRDNTQSGWLSDESS